MRAQRALTAALVAVFVALAALYNLSLPAFEAPDEASHFYYAATIARERVLPEPETGARAQKLHEAFQPPLYYLALAGVIGPFDLTDLDAFVDRQNRDWYAVPGVTNLYEHGPDETGRFAGLLAALRIARLLSTLLGALTILGLIAIVRALAPASRWAPLFAGALLAFTPKFLNMSASVSNDIALTCAATAAIAFMVSRPASTRVRAAAAGGLIAIATLCKVGGIALLAPALVWVWAGTAGAPNTGPAWRRIFGQGLALLVGLFLAGGLWFSRNLVLYGDPLGWARAEAANAITLRDAPLSAFQIVAGIPVWLQSMWGDLAIGQPLPVWNDVFFGLALVGGLAGLLIGFARRRIPAQPGVLILAAWIAALLAGYVGWMRTHTATENGRLLMPAAAACAAFVTLGLRALAGGRIRLARAAGELILATGLVIALLAPITVIQAAYASPRALTENEVRAEFGLAPSRVIFGGQVRFLHAFIGNGRAGAPSVAPGGLLPVSVYWGANGPVGRSLRAIVEVVDARGQVLGRVEAVPYANRFSTLRWLPGAFFRDTYLVPINPGAGRVVAEVRIGLRDPYGPPEILTLEGGERRFIAGRVKVEGPSAGGISASSGPEAAVDAVFGGQIRLVSFASRIGLTTTLNLRFAALRAPDRDYVFFVHATDASGLPAGQSDSEPHNGEYSTTFWAAGETVFETRELRLDRPPARLIAGWYDRATNMRLPVFRADGSAWADNVVILWEARQ